LKQGPQAGADHVVVVDQQNFYGTRCHLGVLIRSG
jgi:hypothetical protein